MAENCCAETGSVFDDAAQQIKQLLPGIPDKVIRRELSDATVRLCLEAEIWRYDFERLDVAEGDDFVDLPTDEGVRVARVIEVFTDAGKGDCSGCGGSSGGCDIRIPERKDIWRCKGNQYWYENMPGRVLLNEPSKGETFRAAVALAPERGGDQFPENLMLKYQDGIMNGALMMAHMMPGQEWTDSERGMYYRALYERSIEQARLERIMDVKPYRPTYNAKDGWKASGGCGC